MPFLTEAQRQSVLDRLLRTIERKFMGAEPDLRLLREAHAGTIVRSESPEAFEQSINTLLRELGASHTGFFHEGKPRVAGRVAIAATFMRGELADGLRWIFQDVHPGGAAAAAGVRPGDTLLAIDGKDIVPPDAIPFALGHTYTLTIREPSGATVTRTVAIPGSKEKNRPLVVPDRVVTTARLEGGIGVVRISMFPGLLGIDVARDTSNALASLNCERVIFDLRGNTGGGIGCLRLMSLLCADRRGVGYTVTRKVARRGVDKKRLPAFDHIPSSKWGIAPLAVRFALRGRSVAVHTEGLGPRPHHGRVVVLVNEHSASAAEMVAGFASEYGLATVVGKRTAGRLVGASAFKVGFGYRVALPVAAYYTWGGTNLEGRGVEPDVPESLLPEALWRGEDNQLLRAQLLLAP